jgi:uroporphyrinogen decarboxylase
MTKRERVLTALAHRESDRVPKGELWIDPGLANRLMGTDYPADYQHFERDRTVREFLNIDLVNVGDWPDEFLGTDADGNRRYRMIYGHEIATNGTSRRIVKPAVADIGDAGGYRTPDIGRVSGKLVREFRERTDLFVMAQIGGPVSMLDEMFPMEDYLAYCMTNTAEIRTIAEKVMDFEVAKAKLFLDSGADAILMTDDIAFNTGVFLPPRVMAEVAYPFYRDAVERIRRHKPVPIVFHSDGDLNMVLDDLVGFGFDCLHSLQPSAGMDMGRIKKEYGKSIALMGNIDLNHVLTFGTPEEVAEDVRRTIAIAAPGGGFILSSCNTLVDAIPAANALAMYRAADGCS